MLYVRDNLANFGLEFDNLNGLQAGVNARYIGHRYAKNWYRKYDKTASKYVPIVLDGTEIRPSLANESVLRHPVSVIFDCNIAYTIKQKYTISITAANLLDENYTEKDGYNMPGRSLTAKFTYRF